MNWGYSITLSFILFMAFIGYLVVGAFRQNVDLVAEDYYAKELKFQEQIVKTSNAVDKEFSYKISENDLTIQFAGAAQGLTGNFLFYKPNDAGKDMVVPMNPDAEGKQTIALVNFHKGKYKIKADWEEGGKKYYHEKIIVF